MHEVEYLESFAGPGSNFTENDKMEVKGGVNTFVNDGSFMEMFRKRMEEEKLRGKEDQSASEVKNGESPGSSGSQRPTGGASEVSSGLTPIDKETLLPEQTAITKTDSGIEQPCDDNLQTLSTQQSAEAIDSNPEIKHEKRKSKWEQKKAIEEVPTENSSNSTSTVTTAQKKYSLLSHVSHFCNIFPLRPSIDLIANPPGWFLLNGPKVLWEGKGSTVCPFFLPTMPFDHSAKINQADWR